MHTTPVIVICVVRSGGKIPKYTFLDLIRKISIGETGYVKYRGTLKTRARKHAAKHKSTLFVAKIFRSLNPVHLSHAALDIVGKNGIEHNFV
jgi:hypothetical protein